ncbi:MAG: hypothetical protein EBS49_00910 [Verrucomicrobia bacterium]|nr:hypothetical protein [Verrucomicrobiota bacterium]NBU68187.1 hypothetical protein [Verrucomicrobiota bacterium]
MAYTYGTPASTTLSETVATTFERVFVQGADGNVKKGFKKFAQGETRTEVYDPSRSSLPSLASGSMSSGATVGYEYRETNTDQPRLSTTKLAWGTF